MNWILIVEADECTLIHELQVVRRICKAIRVCLVIATIVFSVGLLVVVTNLLMSIESIDMCNLRSAVYMIVGCGFAILILWLFAQLFNDVIEGASPFCEEQADRLKSIAVVALSYFLLDFLLSVGFVYEPYPELGFGMVVNDGIAEPTININFGMLAFSAIMYSLSAIFRYAALLQQLSDETV